ncbi:hypothetical protein ACFYXF_44565 [Streptomyces sp. NPDC002680]|uniref:hypothetical protein n=1 Tax=Streptomyces sp. NPDC002680 TaxID=3364659 RepID=UPI00368DBA97
MSAQKKNHEGGPPNSFGMGMGGPLLAGGSWTVWKSGFIGLIGVGGLWLGLGIGSWAIAAFSGLVTLVAAVWLRGALRSHRDARRLERRAAARASDE